jgi:hypothetical protein
VTAGPRIGAKWLECRFRCPRYCWFGRGGLRGGRGLRWAGRARLPASWWKVCLFRQAQFSLVVVISGVDEFPIVAPGGVPPRPSGDFGFSAFPSVWPP